MKSKIIFESSEVVIIHKVAGILSVRSRFHNTQPEENLIDQFANLLPVHRLDREVEGLVLAARNKNAQKICNSWFEKKEIKKSYWALCTEVDLSLLGKTVEKLPFKVEKLDENFFSKLGQTQVWQSKILRGKKRSYSSPGGDRTETHAKLIEISRLPDTTKVYQWELSPITGKSHQLRFEMARHSQPVLGDELYFAPLLPRYPNGIALVARSLNFENCHSREEMGLPENFTLDLDWATFLGRLQSNAIQVAEKE
jgi:23S rRNA-/tRNA-specific pseudouridylate synthase